MAARNDTPARSISSCSTQFHARGGWVPNPVPWITTANEQTRKVRLPNSKTVDRLLPSLEMERKTASPTGRGLSISSPFVLCARAGPPGWLVSIVASLSPDDAFLPLRLQLSSPDDQRSPRRRRILISASFLGLARKSGLGWPRQHAPSVMTFQQNAQKASLDHWPRIVARGDGR